MYIIKAKNILKLLVLIAIFIVFGFSVLMIQNNALAGVPKTDITIVLDAGHGGIDAGITSKSGTKESDINLAITLKLEEKLKRAGYTVILTRKTENGLYLKYQKGFKMEDMRARKKIIEDAGPDAVVSIHQNSFPASSERGLQVFYRERDDKSETLAKAVTKQAQNEELPHLRSNVKPADYFILNCTMAPSILIECGFLTTYEDEMLLKTDKYQNKIAYSVYLGILSYFNTVF